MTVFNVSNWFNKMCNDYDNKVEEEEKEDISKNDIDVDIK